MVSSEAAKLLGLAIPFSAEQAKDAYRRESLKAHPDKGGSNELMSALNEAYRVCSKGITFDAFDSSYEFPGWNFKTAFNYAKQRESQAIRSRAVSWFLSCIRCRFFENKSNVNHLLESPNTWRGKSGTELTDAMKSQIVQLEMAMKNKNYSDIIGSCCDIALVAMMVADKAEQFSRRSNK